MTAAGSIPSRTAGAAPTEAERISGRRLIAGIGLSAAFAAALYAVTTLAARAAAPGWAHTEGLTVLVVAEMYLAVIAGLTVAAGGPRGVTRLLALRRPSVGQLKLVPGLFVVVMIAGFAVPLAFSPLAGGPAAVAEAVIRAGSDESRMPTATALTWALIVIRLVALTGAAEELLFRGALYGWLRRRCSVTLAIGLTAVLFTLEHSYYPILIPLVLADGLASGWLRHHTRTIATTIVLHVCVDLSVFLAAVPLAR